ncbi:MAG: RIO1 family regulatory kinase/ATPase [Candidatus Asgardarchaeia archaeon]
MSQKDSLNEVDIAILRVIDGLRTIYEYAPIESVIEKLPYAPKKVIYHVERLAKFSLVKYVYVPQLNTKGVRITEKGFDALALWDFKKHDVISEVGHLIGVGKEATIISALDYQNEFLVVKFHRWWIHEFKKIKKSLAYASIIWRGEQLNIEDYEIEVPRAKAQIEMYALQKLSSAKIPVPEPRSINRHAIVMKMIERERGVPAPRLVDIRISNPEEAYDLIIEDYIHMVNKCNIVHGDLSEFNILIDNDGNLYYIDFPQAVPTDFPGAYELAFRDIRNINNYFAKKYNVNVTPVEDILENLKIE